MESIIEKINRGLNLPRGMNILHTSPHHDDEMLAYYPILPELINENQNSFLYITSGFHSVTDNYLIKLLYATPEYLIEYPPEKGSFLDLVAIVFGIPDLHSLREKIHWLKMEHVPHIEEVKVLKGAIREQEAEKMLSQLGVESSQMHHLRAQFYDGGDPEIDAIVLKDLINEIHPDFITIAYDAQDHGPKTHHRSYDVIMRAIELSDIKPQIWAYRNVWSRFTLEEADILIPVSEDQLGSMNDAFVSCFQSQKIAAFPSKDFHGPFSQLSEKIMREQYIQLKNNLPDDFLKNHPDYRMRNAKGFIWIKTFPLLP